jgi:hypothetical protein
MDIGKTRLNVTVDADVPEMLAKLARGRNKMGEYLSNIVRSMAQGTEMVEIDQMDVEALRLMVQGLGGRVKAVEGEMINMRAQIATLIANAEQASKH